MHKPAPEAFLTGAFEACELKAAKETTSNRSQTPQQSTNQAHSPTSSTNYCTYIHVKSGKNPKPSKPSHHQASFPNHVSLPQSCLHVLLWQLSTFPSLLAKVRAFHTLLSTLKHDLSKPPLTNTKQVFSLHPLPLQTKPCQDEYLKVEPRLLIGPSERSVISTDNQNTHKSALNPQARTEAQHTLWTGSTSCAEHKPWAPNEVNFSPALTLSFI